jgi:2-methylaconitate cis-trans-isomerase PrpF
VDDGVVHKRIQHLLESHPRSSSFRPTIRILAADTGKIVKATLGISPRHDPHDDVTQGWYAHTEGTTRISGVPGTAAPVHIETPLDGNLLPTGKEQDVLNFEGEQVSCKSPALNSM